MRAGTIRHDDDLGRDAQLRALGQQASRAQGFVVGMGGDHGDSFDAGEIERHDRVEATVRVPFGSRSARLGRVECHHGDTTISASVLPSEASSFSA